VTSSLSTPIFSATPAEEIFNWLDDEATQRGKAGLGRTLSPRGVHAQQIDLASDDYLGLAKDKRVAGAAAAASLKWGAGATSSRSLLGSTELHAELEYELAKFHGSQSALVFSTGFTANLAAVTALSGSEAAIVADKYLHGSLVEGCRLSRSDVAAFPHNDIAAVEKALATRRKQRALVVTDSIYFPDGELTPLVELEALCRKYSAALIVNDAHGFGIVGTGGKGVVRQAGLAGSPNVVTTISLAKSLGAQGGAVLGPRRVIKHLAETARGFLLDTALAPASTAAALAALTIIKAEPELPEKALNCSMELARQITKAGFSLPMPYSPMLCLRAPSTESATAWVAKCAEAGVAVSAVGPPHASDGVPRIRLAAKATLSESDVDRAVKVIVDSAPAIERRVNGERE
jgi:8-amino-7-oxononanoate synthase